MSPQDKQIQCSDCGATFTFTAEEQEFYKTKGYTNEPKRCQPCRAAKKEARGESSYGGPRRAGTGQTYPATCSQCGKPTQLPFEPKTGRPVYCSDCYRSIKPSR